MLPYCYSELGKWGISLIKKYKCTVAYDGTAYAGSQIQPQRKTIQGEIETALSILHKDVPVKVTLSGRTDAGVHARGQVFHFESNLAIPLTNWPKAINSLLPDDIRIIDIEEVSLDFHARFDCLWKEYRYFIYTGKVADPFRRLYSYHYPFPLSLQSIQAAAQLLIGTHDFSAFSSTGTDVENKVRTIYHLDCQQQEDNLVISIKGNGFLYNMVRIIVGTLLEVGQGRKSLHDIQLALSTGEREHLGRTAPAHGLFLWKVEYKDKENTLTE